MRALRPLDWSVWYYTPVAKSFAAHVNLRSISTDSHDSHEVYVIQARGVGAPLLYLRLATCRLNGPGRDEAVNQTGRPWLRLLYVVTLPLVPPFDRSLMKLTRQ